MLKQLYSRYKQFPALKQLSILYAINWIWWFIAYMIGERIFLEEQHSILYHLFDATFTALFWTLLWNYASFKMLFSKKTEKH